ncbi:hypothetical protein L249_2566 [Ophiocordyceps polyrhachis-furcata BCC 54312]|uniref:Uncharacterized protein n=1 Tax=Ophiocordyceps polyrhachis-furcata BCC 54312 TaxID=1330021 RepID=A0A367LN22_9HYPO|nr:hypothetical protein L249_2566 [Ophiocordyceps polyrhachis-furcata BCC 54312]
MVDANALLKMPSSKSAEEKRDTVGIEVLGSPHCPGTGLLSVPNMILLSYSYSLLQPTWTCLIWMTYVEFG